MRSVIFMIHSLVCMALVSHAFFIFQYVLKVISIFHVLVSRAKPDSRPRRGSLLSDTC